MAERAAMHRPCPWHQPVLAALLARRRAGQLPHALLLRGQAGIGKERLARALAEALLCRQPAADGTACGCCTACHQSLAGTHPDLFPVTVPEERKGIAIDQIRDLVEFCERTAQAGGPRVALITPAEAMNRNAQNALLKTLEEPGADTVLILVSDQPGLLLPTVRSRCQQIPLATPPAEVAIAWLDERLGDRARAASLLQAAAGAPLRALALDGSDWYAERTKLLAQCVGLVEGRFSPSQAAQPFLAHEALDMLDLLHGWAHAGLRLLAGRPPADAELVAPLERLAQRVGARRLLAFADHCMRMRQALARGGNPNRELLIEQALLVLAMPDAADA